MSLDKAIEHKKEWRKPYYGAKSVDHACRNNGSCNWCRENRLYKSIIQQDIVDSKLDEYEKGEMDE